MTAPTDPIGPRAATPPPVPAGPAAAPETKVGFAGGTRFVVFAREDEASFAVFDRTNGETFRVLGTPMGEAHLMGSRFSEMGVATGGLAWDLVSDHDGRMLVRSVGGVQLVDLEDRRHLVAAWRGSPEMVSLAPDGRTFAVSTRDALHLVRASDGAIATFALSSTTLPTWGDVNAHWIDGDKLTRVDRTTLVASVVKGAPGAKLAASREANVVAIAAGGFVEVHVAGTTAPVVRLAGKVLPAAEVDSLTVDRDGTKVVWIERLVDETKYTDVGHLHAIDVEDRSHVRFAMVNSGCGNAPETLEAVRDGKIITDPSCAIGCPSVRWTHRAVTYDASTGKIEKDVSTTETASWNEEQGAFQSEIEDAAKKLGVEVGAMMNQPSRETTERFLVGRASRLELVTLKDTGVRVDFETSRNASLASLTFSDDGAVLAGVVDGRMRVWETSTGRALLR